MFKGSMVALVTPMHADGSIDKTSFKALIDWHIQSGTDAIVVAGTTGESATLSKEEQFEIIALANEHIAGRLPLIAGAGSNATDKTILLSKQAKKAGANALLLVTPYYNKPTQAGLYAHFKAVAKAVDLPIILYNVPARTACDLQPETVQRLAEIPNLIGIKEATGKLDRAKIILETCPGFKVYSGDDITALSLMQHGAHGVISVTANVAPLKMHQMCEAVFQGQGALAEKINADLQLLHERLFSESNPIPTKWALHQLGKIPAGIRLPLLTLDKRYHQGVKEAMQNAGVT